MYQVHSTLVAAVVGCALLMTGCESRIDNGDNKGSSPTAHRIVFSVGSGTNCQQKLDSDNPVSDFVAIKWGDTVAFSAVKADGSSATFTVTFPPGTSATCDSPFQTSSCQSSISSSAATPSGGMKFPYSSLTVNGQQCGNPAQLGLIMRP